MHLSSALLALTLAALTGCSTLTVEADVSTQLSGDFRYLSGAHDFHGAHVGRLAVMLEQPVTRSVECRLGIEHRSLLDTSRDRGEERVVVGVTWRPFAGIQGSGAP